MTQPNPSRESLDHRGIWLIVNKDIQWYRRECLRSFLNILLVATPTANNATGSIRGSNPLRATCTIHVTRAPTRPCSYNRAKARTSSRHRLYSRHTFAIFVGDDGNPREDYRTLVQSIQGAVTLVFSGQVGLFCPQGIISPAGTFCLAC